MRENTNTTKNSSLSSLKNSSSYLPSSIRKALKDVDPKTRKSENHIHNGKIAQDVWDRLGELEAMADAKQGASKL